MMMTFDAARNREELRAIAKCVLWVPAGILCSLLFGDSWGAGGVYGALLGLALAARNRQVRTAKSVGVVMVLIAFASVLHSNWGSYRNGVNAGFDAAFSKAD